MEKGYSSLDCEGPDRNLAALDVCWIAHLAAAAKIVLKSHDAWPSENHTRAFDVTMTPLIQSYLGFGTS